MTYCQRSEHERRKCATIIHVAPGLPNSWLRRGKDCISSPGPGVTECSKLKILQRQRLDNPADYKYTTSLDQLRQHLNL